MQKIGDEDTISPFFTVSTIDIAVSWSAIFKGKVVAEIAMNNPVVNFKASKIEEPEEETDFVKALEDIVPLRIEIFKIHNGELHYLDKAKDPVVDVYLTNINATANNLSNMDRDEDPLPSKVSLSGTTNGGGTLNVQLAMFIMKQIPDFDLKVELSVVNLTAFNAFTEAYGNFDFEKGTFYVSTEVVMKDEDYKGYLKPVMENYGIIDL